MISIAQVASCEQDQLVDLWKVPLKWVDAVVCPYAGVIGEIFAFSVVIVAINSALYARQQRLVGPAAVTLVTGGAWLSLTAGGLQGAVQAGILVLIGIGPVLLIRRLDR